MKTASVKKLFLSGIFCLLGLAVLSHTYNLKFIHAVNAFPFEKKQEEQQRKKGSVKIRGFNPGAKVSYQMIPSHGAPTTGQAVIDSNGMVQLPAIDLSKNDAAQMAYNLIIENNSQAAGPLNILLRLNGETEKISVSGSGLRKFSNIAVEKNAGVLKTKADWAGVFDEKDVLKIDDLSENKSFKIAFQNYNLASDARPEHSSIIEVQILTTPGLGGGPTSANVNQFTATGSELLSTYNTAAVQQSIDNIVDNYVTALMLMTEQLSAVMMQHVQIIGSFLDAKMQLETQRTWQQLQAQAHKDYHPSDQMCRFGTFVRSIAHTEAKTEHDKRALNKILTDRYVNIHNSSSTEGSDAELRSRLGQFRTIHCDPADNNNGLGLMCSHPGGIGGDDPGRMNKDIDFTRTLYNPLTLDIDFTNDGGEPAEVADEQDIIALAKNLYWPRPFETAEAGKLQTVYPVYMDARRIIAMENVAHNSFVSLVGTKIKAPNAIGEESGWVFMKSMLREFGLTNDDDIHQLLGENPSYNAQMDVLTKKIYQHPDFYTNLYDKPTNVRRISVSMKAISLMHDRDRFEASLRREMLISMMVEQELLEKSENLNVRIFSGMKEAQTIN